jgi:antitoxin (DNA-binding transcriptional repressor) of toxin-antitoxin stability system
MITVNIRQAKRRLSKLIAKAEAGEEVLILRGTKPVVQLRAVSSKRFKLTFGMWSEKMKARRVPGMLKGKVSIPDEFFFDPLPEEELRLWECAGDDRFCENAGHSAIVKRCWRPAAP